jgi:threonine/homoserine/homoserine lactone efflux protein
MPQIITYLAMGAVFGLTAGISPGPLLTLVISETLRHNKSEGLKIAITPLITDIPIVLLTIFLISKMSGSDIVLGTISILGGIFIAYLGFDSIRSKGLALKPGNLRPRSMRRGIIVNMLSPHPYIFWLMVGGPVTLRAYQASQAAAIAFIVAFYAMLVGSKVSIALLVDRSKAFMRNRVFVWTLRILGMVLMMFALLLILEGLNYFGLLPRFSDQ